MATIISEEIRRRHLREDAIFEFYAARYEAFRREAAIALARAVREDHDPGDEDRSER